MGSPKTITLHPNDADLGDLRAFAMDGALLALDPDCRPAVEAANRTVADIVAAGETVYGVNTGFGKLAQTRIEDDRLADLQRNIVLSHAAGTGPLLEDRAVRLTMILKVLSLARGHSGVRWEIIEALLALIEHDVNPCIPAKGSVGASGDLAPLAHMAAVLLGVGEARVAGKTVPATEALAKAGLEPIALAPKEGLALLNGTQVSTALALIGLFTAEDVFAAGLVAGAMSIDAALGSDAPFDERLNGVRAHAGQFWVAGELRRLLDGSEIRKSHLDCDRVQDPYSLRCQPQVMGACLDVLVDVSSTLAIEATAVTDNPLVFPETGEVLSGGNFHAEPVAMAADIMALALAEIGALSERRIALLIDSNLSGLPPFLTHDPGLNSGFMMPQVTAAALASENKALAHPSSVDSLPTSANQEDHVSMATYAARRLGDMADNTAGIVAIELLAAAQGLDLRAPLATSPALKPAHAAIRAVSPMLEGDRFLAPDIEAVKQLVLDGTFTDYAGDILPHRI